jgi:hypothetical protein
VILLRNCVATTISMKGIQGFQKGHSPTPEMRLKMRLAKLGKPRLDLVGHPMYQNPKRNEKIRRAKTGRPASPETRRKMREAHLKRFDGYERITSISQRIRGSLEYRLWRETVFRRDDYTCQRCKARSAKGKAVILHAHHDLPFSKFPDLRFEVLNGVTLCVLCHKLTPGYQRKFSNY